MVTNCLGNAHHPGGMRWGREGPSGYHALVILSILVLRPFSRGYPWVGMFTLFASHEVPVSQMMKHHELTPECKREDTGSNCCHNKCVY